MHSRQWKNEDNDLEVGVRLVRLRKRKANKASVKTEIRRVKRNGTVCGLCVGFMDHGVGLRFNCKEKPLEGSDTNGQRGVWGEVKGKLLQWSR